MRTKSETPPNPSHHGQAHPTETQKASVYEQSREERIKENLERMEKLGIFDLSLKFKSLNPPPKRTQRNSSDRNTPLRPSGPTRRSSRLQSVTPVSYVEVDALKKGKSLEEGSIFLEEGSKPEIYTEEHEKLLGNTEKSWTLFVDGYGKDGKRIYDQVRGKTCHQCRQKTLGYRTHCSNCSMVQGQFCGDCLYMRYGEHVLEAIENPDWICPACRGICNCSFCRQNKGWPPTGSLYRKISKLGFKSVAHYLIGTRRSSTISDKDADATNQVSAKRSLPFSHIGSQSEESPKVDTINLETSPPQPEVKSEDEFKGEKENKMQSSPNPDTNNQVSARRSLLFSDIEAQSKNLNSLVVDHEVNELPTLSKPQSREKRDGQFKGEKESELHFTDKEHHDCNNALESCQKLKKKRALAIEPSPDSIAGRLRQRHRKDDGLNDEGLQGVNEKILGVKEAVKNISSENDVEKEKEMHLTENKCNDDNIASEGTPKLQKKRVLAAEPNMSSIAGRLRQRRLCSS